jgi:riboflavin transporter FmnP
MFEEFVNYPSYIIGTVIGTIVIFYLLYLWVEKRFGKKNKKRKRFFQMKSYEVTAFAALAAISAVLQIVHLGWLSPWGMWIDLVAVSWMTAYFLYGGRAAFIVSLVGAIIITLVAPSTWLGAGMKWLATLPMWLVPLAMQKTLGKKMKDFRKPALLVAAVAIAILLRCMIVIPVNYYFAIPVWTGMTTAQAIEAVPWWAIFALNAVQGAVEVALAWLLVFRFRLDRFAAWQ